MLQCDSNASMRNVKSDAFAKRNLWIPSEKTEADINFKSMKHFMTCDKENTVSFNCGMGMYSL